MNSLISSTAQVSIVTASKNLIDKLISMNTRNRVPKGGQINKLAHDIKSGNWELTASGIGVSKTGVLLDGQNRLMAIREAGYPPIKFVLATGLEDSSQRVVDRHAKRSLSDALTMFMNITVSSQMVALANVLYGLGITKGKSEPFIFARGGLSDSEAANFMVSYSDLAHEIVGTAVGCRAPVAAAMFVYALHNHDQALEFARDVAKGINLSEDHPAYRLRLSMERLKSSNDASARMELVKLAANACINHSIGKNIKLLKAAESWENSRWKWAITGKDIFDVEDSANGKNDDNWRVVKKDYPGIWSQLQHRTQAGA